MNKIKSILLNVFGDGFFGLERDQNTQEEITNGYREYQKKHKKPEPAVCYSIPYPPSSSCSFMGSDIGNVFSTGSTTQYHSGQNNVAVGHQGLSKSCNDRFIESHNE